MSSAQSLSKSTACLSRDGFLSVGISVWHLAFFILVSMTTRLSAQSPNTQDNSGVQPGQTYAQDKETINPATGSLNLQIPVLHLPGRAGHDLTLAISYSNQSILSIGFGEHPVPGAPGGDGSPAPGVTQYVLGWGASSSYGWSLNLPGVGFTYLNASHDDNTGGNSACTGYPVVGGADGRTASFGLAMFGCAAGVSPTNTNGLGPSFTTAADDQGSDIIADIGAPAGPTFFYPDGHRLIIPAAPAGQNLQELSSTTLVDVDRSGNVITYVSDNYQNPTQTVITDTLGRQVIVHQAAMTGSYLVTGPSSVTYMNSNGQAEAVTFIYGGGPVANDDVLDQPSIVSSASGAGYGLADYNSSQGVPYIQYVGFQGAPTINLSQRPLSAIVLANGQTYTFQYDASET